MPSCTVCCLLVDILKDTFYPYFSALCPPAAALRTGKRTSDASARWPSFLLSQGSSPSPPSFRPIARTGVQHAPQHSSRHVAAFLLRKHLPAALPALCLVISAHQQHCHIKSGSLPCHVPARRDGVRARLAHGDFLECYMRIPIEVGGLLPADNACSCPRPIRIHGNPKRLPAAV